MKFQTILLNQGILVILLSLMFLAPIQTSSAITEPMWIDGTITGPVTEDIFDTNQFWVFNFTVSNTNRTDLVAINSVVKVLCWKALGGGFEEDGFYSFNGRIVDVQVGDKPLGSFVVASVNSQNGGSTIWDQLLEIFGFIMQIIPGIVKGIVQLVEMLTGIVIPELLITILLIVLPLWFVLKNLKTLSILLVIVFGFLVFGSGINLIQLLWLAIV